MSGLFGRPGGQAASNVNGDLAKDVQLASPPEDSISALAWSPVANYLAVSSWDSKVRIYDVTQKSEGTGVALIDFDGPVFACDWSKDGQKVVGAGADKTAKVLDLGANGAPAQQIAAHDQPIRTVKFVDIPGQAAQMVVTGSWDKTVKYWDLRSPAAVATVELSDRVYAMDARDKLLVVATGDRKVNIIDLNTPQTVFQQLDSPLKHQTRAVCCFKEGDGYMIGSIEGRCAFQHIDPKDASKNLSFKCHRAPIQKNTNTIDVYTVNALSVHPKFGSFSSAGSDGTFHFWDKESRSRLKGFSDGVGGSISATAFNHKGDIFAYAVSYDWHKGYATNKPDYPNKVMMHPVADIEVKPKKWRG